MLDRLKPAGYFAIIYSIMIIPFLLMRLLFGPFHDAVGFMSVIQIYFHVFYVALYVYMFSTLRILLEDHFNFFDVSRLITRLIIIQYASVIFDIVTLIFVPFFPLAGMIRYLVSIIMLALYFIVLLVFAIKLLWLNDNLFGMLKPFSYTAIAIPLYFYTVVLIPVGIVFKVVNSIILSIIFFRAAKELGNDKREESANKSIILTK